LDEGTTGNSPTSTNVHWCRVLDHGGQADIKNDMNKLNGVTRVNSINVQDKGLRIGGIGRRMNSKVKISQTRRVLRINVVVDLAYSQSVPERPLLAPIYR
jgi:hypothetical protein